MKKIVIFSALAMFALGAVVGRASVPAPMASRTVAEAFSPAAIILVNQNLPIESFDAI